MPYMYTYICIYIYMYVYYWPENNELATWLTLWVKNNWEIHSKELWGNEFWSDIWEIVYNTDVSVFHVDAHGEIIRFYFQGSEEFQHHRPLCLNSGMEFSK